MAIKGPEVGSTSKLGAMGPNSHGSNASSLCLTRCAALQTPKPGTATVYRILRFRHYLYQLYKSHDECAAANSYTAKLPTETSRWLIPLLIIPSALSSEAVVRTYLEANPTRPHLPSHRSATLQRITGKKKQQASQQRKRLSDGQKI